MFKIFLLMAVFLLSPPVAAQSKCDAFISDVTSKDISINGVTQAFVSEHPACLTVIRGGKSQSIFLTDVDEVEDIGPAPVVSLSPSGMFVAVQFAAGEDDHVVMVFDAVSLKRIFAEKAAEATWIKSRDELLLIPNYEMMGEQTTKGLISFFPHSKKRRMIATQYFFTGGLLAGGNQLVAWVVWDNRGESVTRPIIYDTSTRKVISSATTNSVKNLKRPDRTIFRAAGSVPANRHTARRGQQRDGGRDDIQTRADR